MPSDAAIASGPCARRADAAARSPRPFFLAHHLRLGAPAAQLFDPALLGATDALQAAFIDRAARQRRQQRALPFRQQRFHLLSRTTITELIQQTARGLEQPGVLPVDGARQRTELVRVVGRLMAEIFFGRLRHTGRWRELHRSGLRSHRVGVSSNAHGLCTAFPHLTNRAALGQRQPTLLIRCGRNTRQHLSHGPRDLSHRHGSTQLRQDLHPASETARRLYPACAALTTLDPVCAER